MAVRYHQKCYKSPWKEDKALPTSNAATSIQGYEKGGFFTYRGEDTGYFYTATGDRLSVFKSNGYIEDAALSFTIPFGSTANIIDCIYFPLNETSPGLVVAVHDSSLTQHKHKFYLAYVSLTKKRVLKKVAAPGQVNSLANIIDGAQYPSQVNGLNAAFQRNWPHIIGISIYESGAALTHLAMKSEDEEHGEHCHKAANVIVLGKNFVSGDSFTFQDDQNRKYSGQRSNFYVSKFAFIERCAIIVMGFPFGGIYMVSLRTQRPYTFFMAEGVIEDCAIQDADDDPRGFFYLWFALSRGDKAHALSAYAIFPEEDEKKKCYDNPQFVFSVNFTLSDFMSFLSLRTMLVDRSRLAGSPKDPDASLNESVVSNNKSSSLALFTWLSSTKPTRVYGALFDLNMYYFKRTPSRLTPDDTELRQIPFCSGFQTDDSIDVKNLEIFDIALMPKSLRAFVSVDNDDKDQLFYPSVYSFSFKTLTRKNALYLNVDSIQDQFLKEVSANFVENWSNPSNACMKFHALGIGALPYESNDKRFYQLSTLLKHGYHFCIVGFILNDDTDVADLKFLLKWINKEIEVNKDNLDRFCHPLLNGGEVSHTAMHFIKFSEYLFYRICQLIDALIERVEKLEEEEPFLKQLKITWSVANGIHLYSTGIKFGIAFQILPQKEGYIKVNQDLQKMFYDRILSSDHATLSIIKLIQECMDSAPDSSIWENKSPQMWYPPQNYSTWLGVFLMVNLSKTAKVTLFGYYLLELVKKGLCQDDKLLDKGLGYFLLSDNEKSLAIKRRIEKMYKADDILSRSAGDDVLEHVLSDMKNLQNEAIQIAKPSPIRKEVLRFDEPSPIQNDSIMSPVVNKDIGDKMMTDKQWERIKQITKTPPATPMVSRLMLSPEPSSVKRPTSILKSNKKESRITSSTKRVKLQFDDNLQQIKSIPNRHEQRTPVPDVFTMEDSSIISEVEHQQIEDDDSLNEPDLSYGPVKLNFDICDDDETHKISNEAPDTRINVEGRVAPAELEKSMEIDDEIPEPLPVKPVCLPSPSVESSVEAPDTQKLPGLRKRSHPTEEHVSQSQPVKSMESIAVVHEPLPVKPKRVRRRSPSHESSIEPPDTRKSPRLRKSSVNTEEHVSQSQPVKSMESIAEVPEPLPVKPKRVRTPSRESAIEAPNTRKSPRSRKSSVGTEDHVLQSHPVKSMESIAKVPEPLPVKPKRVRRRSPSHESSIEPPDTRKTPRLRKSSVNTEDHVLQSQPVKSMESIAEVPKPLPVKSKRVRTPSRESSIEPPDIRKSPRLRKSSVNTEDHFSQSQPAKSMESIAEVPEPPSPRGRGRPKKL